MGGKTRFPNYGSADLVASVFTFKALFFSATGLALIALVHMIADGIFAAWVMVLPYLASFLFLVPSLILGIATSRLYMFLFSKLAMPNRLWAAAYCLEVAIFFLSLGYCILVLWGKEQTIFLGSMFYLPSIIYAAACIRFSWTTFSKYTDLKSSRKRPDNPLFYHLALLAPFIILLGMLFLPRETRLPVIYASWEVTHEQCDDYVYFEVNQAPLDPWHRDGIATCSPELAEYLVGSGESTARLEILKIHTPLHWDYRIVQIGNWSSMDRLFFHRTCVDGASISCSDEFGPMEEPVNTIYYEPEAR